MQLWRLSPSSRGGKGYFTWLGDECGVCRGASRLLAPSLSFLSISFFFLLYYSSYSFPSPLPLSSHRSVTLSLLFSPICSNRHAHRMYCTSLYDPPPSLPFLNVSLSSSSPQRIGRRPEMKVTRWLSHRLQHRTWVLPVFPARVLCCSQWSRLTAADLSSSRTVRSSKPWTCRRCSSLVAWISSSAF